MTYKNCNTVQVEQNFVLQNDIRRDITYRTQVCDGRHFRNMKF